MSEHELDKAIAAVRADEPDASTIRAAAARARETIGAQLSNSPVVEQIRSCSDFQALLPAFRARTLPASRTLLVQDHLLECADCRRMYKIDESSQTSRNSAPRRHFNPRLAWAVAATLVVGFAIGKIVSLRTGAGILYDGPALSQEMSGLTVSGVQGTLYRISPGNTEALKAGAILGHSETLRTGRGSHAFLKTTDGGTIELDESSNASLVCSSKRTVFTLEQGRAIVHGRRDRKGLFVSAGAITAPVQNAVYSFNRGLRGSRVSLAEGRAEVKLRNASYNLSAGEQMATDGLDAVPVRSEFAWSANAPDYLSLLGELSNLEKQIDRISGPGLRYSSTLAPYVPANSVLYATVPNVGSSLAEIKQLFEARLSESQVLQDWWSQLPSEQRTNLEKLVDQTTAISKYLGEEVVLSAVPSGNDQHPVPLLLAHISAPGLAPYLEANFPATGMQVFTNADQIGGVSTGKLLVFVGEKFLVASGDADTLRGIVDSVTKEKPGAFADTAFYSRISNAYRTGVGYLLAVDWEQFRRQSVKAKGEDFSGLSKVEYLVLERRPQDGTAETRASLSFAGTRQGLASWLGAPGPMGSLNYVSPDALFAVSFVMRNPRDVLQELLSTVSQTGTNGAQKWTQFESMTGVNILDDLAAPVGSNATFALDGPLVPTPSWKFVMEVNDPAKLNATFAKLITHLNAQPGSEHPTLTTGSDQMNGQVVYWVRNDKSPNTEVFYTFANGYLILGPNEALVLQTIEQQRSGYSLSTSDKLRSQLPADSSPSFSGLVYANSGSSFGSLTRQLTNNTALSSDQKNALTALLTNTSPSVICLYGEPSQIVASTRSSFLGFNLKALAGVHEGRPVLPAFSGKAGRSTL
jgi:hypothetical protein